MLIKIVNSSARQRLNGSATSVPTLAVRNSPRIRKLAMSESACAVISRKDVPSTNPMWLYMSSPGLLSISESFANRIAKSTKPSREKNAELENMMTKRDVNTDAPGETSAQRFSYGSPNIEATISFMALKIPIQAHSHQYTSTSWNKVTLCMKNRIRTPPLATISPNAPSPSRPTSGRPVFAGGRGVSVVVMLAPFLLQQPKTYGRRPYVSARQIHSSGPYRCPDSHQTLNNNWTIQIATITK